MIITPKAALEGERKQITELFAALKSSMELLADRDPEDAQRILEVVVRSIGSASPKWAQVPPMLE